MPHSTNIPQIADLFRFQKKENPGSIELPGFFAVLLPKGVWK